MSLVDKVEFFVKKRAADIALRFNGYNVKKSNCTLHVFDGMFEFCRVQKSQYLLINELPVKQEFTINAYFLGGEDYKGAKRIFKFLRIPVHYPKHFVHPDGHTTIIDNGR